MEFSKTLPFPRGSTYSDKGLKSLGVQTVNDGGTTETSSAQYPGEELLGQIFTVPDTVHKKHPFVKLRVVQNHNVTTTSLTVARACLEFVTGAGDFGRKVKAVVNGQGQAGKPYDDAYAVGYTILPADLFYVVEEGPCDILTTASQTLAAALSIAGLVTTGARGYLDGAVAAGGDFQLGTLDEEPLTAATAYRVYVHAGLAMPDAAG